MIYGKIERTYVHIERVKKTCARALFKPQWKLCCVRGLWTVFSVWENKTYGLLFIIIIFIITLKHFQKILLEFI